MKFSDLSVYLEKLEKTTSRNTMVEILAELFSKISDSEIDKVIYLLQGRVAPLFVALEFGMADKMMLRAISLSYGADGKKVLTLYKKTGDLGETAETLSKEKKQIGGKIDITEVFEILLKTAKTGGEGSVDQKITLMSNLFQQLDPLSAKFISRIPVGKLRLGFSDMTVLDAFSWMLSKSKTDRPEIERAYNVRPDLGYIGNIIKTRGLKGLKHVLPEVFTPIRMARAERLPSGEEIIEKIGACAIEPKIDGFRLQAHYKKNRKPGDNVRLYTRNFEDVTFMYPDVVAGIQKQMDVHEAIFEGEAIAYNPESGEFLPFQETVQRKRKYGIAEKAIKTPLKLITFEFLFCDGESLLGKPYITRREMLSRHLKKGDTLILSEEKTVSKPKEVELEFETAISRGLEGIMAKKLDGVYRAGARDWNWIKLKRSYQSTLEDTVDTVVMGYYTGQGKRTSFGIGAFLIGVYDGKKDAFVTVAKIGTGLTDVEWRELHKRCNNLRAQEKPPLYEVDKMLVPDVWVEPEIVVEIRADEITRSPVHTAGRVLKPSKSGGAFDVDVPGFALRFPRLERFRDDKKAEDATNLREVEAIFEAQKKQRK